MNTEKETKMLIRNERHKLFGNLSKMDLYEKYAKKIKTTNISIIDYTIKIVRKVYEKVDWQYPDVQLHVFQKMKIYCVVNNITFKDFLYEIIKKDLG